tara:strand:+ start:71 stop:535 length:465 start_codon:yes stop_codon:yes gene_type:complete
MRSDYLNDNSSLAKQFIKVKKITENYTCLASDSGSLILVNPTAATTVTLPTISEDLVGWNVKVVLTEDAAGAGDGISHIVNIALTGTVNIGMIQEVDGTAGDFCVSGDDYIVNTASGAPGNTFDIWCDGYRWYVQGVVDDLSNAAFSTGADTIA